MDRLIDIRAKKEQKSQELYLSAVVEELCGKILSISQHTNLIYGLFKFA